MIDNYQRIRILGEGASSRVYEAIRSDGFNCALKVFKERNEENLKLLNNEVDILGRLDHPKVVRLYGHSEEENKSVKEKMFICLELAKKGTLFDYLCEVQVLPEITARFFFLQLIDGLSYVHEKGFVHLDIKEENLLLDHCYQLKIADFGLADR